MSQPADTPDKIRLLHVDDEEFQLEAVKGFLNMFDPLIEIISINSSIEALRILENGYFDGVITDFKMPEMNGIELSKKIRAKKTLPIILYTGQGSEEVAEAAFRAGVTDYIRKEMDPSHYYILAKKIRDAVEKNRIEDLYTRVVEDSREAIAIIVNDKIVYSNTALAELLGERKVGDIVGKKFTEFLQPQDREEVEKNIFLNPLGENMKYFQPVLRRRDGKKIVAEISISIINYGGKKAILNFVRDISERKKLEEEIKSSESSFRTLVNMNPDGIALLDLRGEVTWINPMFSRILGYTEKEIIGKSFFSIGSIQTSQYLKNMEIFRNLSKGVYVPPFELHWIRKDKEKVSGEAHFSVVNLGSHEKEIMVITRDVTQQNKIKEELENYSKKLEKLVQDKTVKLVDSEKMITAGKLTSLLANDIREPLIIIKNAVNSMRNNPEDRERSIERINQALLSSIAMLDDLRTKTRDNPLKLEEINIKYLINEVIKENPLPPKIKVKFEVNDIYLTIDVQQVKRVILNIIQNAIEAIEGQGTIKITLKQSNESIIIEIEDNGRGIIPEDMTNIFKPFFTTKKDGLGLGLSYSKKVIEAHNGQVIVNSRAGKGTTVDLKLPLSVLKTEKSSMLQISK